MDKWKILEIKNLNSSERVNRLVSTNSKQIRTQTRREMIKKLTNPKLRIRNLVLQSHMEVTDLKDYAIIGKEKVEPWSLK